MIQPQYAQPFAQGTPSANAVNIQIFEPKAYASPQQPSVQPGYTNQFYSYPQTSLYNPQQQFMQYPMMQQMSSYLPPQMPLPMPVQQSMAQPMQIPPQMPLPMPVQQQYPTYTASPEVIQPQFQEMPPTILQQPAVQPMPSEVAPQAQNIPSVDIQQTPQTTVVDVASLVSGLQSSDPAVQDATITKIADYSQEEPAIAQQVLNEQIMTGLANIIGQDISNLPGPSPEQVAVLEKSARGEQLTEDEINLAKQPSPQAVAAKNKIISMFTLAMLQKNQRDELDAYMASQSTATNLKPLQIQDLIGFNEIQNAIQNDVNPEIRLAGIQVLSYVAKPEDAPIVQSVLQNSLNDPEPLIQQAANETLVKIGAAPQVTAQAA